MAIGSRKKIFLGPYYAKCGLKGRLMVIRIRHSLLCSFGNYYSFIIPMTNTIYILLYSIGGLLITLSTMLYTTRTNSIVSVLVCPTCPIYDVDAEISNLQEIKLFLYIYT